VPVWARTLLFTVLFPGTVTILLPFLLLRSGWGRVEPGPWRSLGLPVLAAGAAVYAWCARDFAVRGRGTPAPWDAPRRLVVEGLYRHVRNPMYVGILSILAGEAVFFGSAPLLGYGALVFLAFRQRVVSFEGPALRRAFGDAFHAYCESVGRWLPRRARR
jgi:protein-S-isoprenylcysteine O-methyltransferase Ste14